MISPERLLKFILKYLLYVGLPLLLLLCLAVAVEVIHPEFEGLGRFLGNTLVNVLPGVTTMFAVPLVASWYLDRLYGMGGLLKAHGYLCRSMFGQTSAKPWLVIKEGKIDEKGDRFLARLGGPGLLIIYNDSAVITEQNGQLKRVLKPGYCRIEHFERIWEIVDLRPQHWVHTVSALTRDGIPISCDADITFRIDDRTYGIPVEPADENEMPYPFTKEAVLKAATATWIREEERDDQVMKWTGRVIISNTEGALRSILAQYRLDELVQPGQPSDSRPTREEDQRQSDGSNATREEDQRQPDSDKTIREEIRQQLRNKLEESAPKVGARILNVDIGKIDIKVDLPKGEEQAAEELSDEVLKQWIETWQAELERVALTQRAEGEAALVSLEAVSVQAQAEMILTLTEAVQSLISTKEADTYRLALCFIETLRWMSFDPNVRTFVPLETLRSLQKLHEIVERTSLLPGQAVLPEGDSRQRVEEIK